jgi:hypothetical protein
MKLHEILILYVSEPDKQIFLRSQMRFRMQFLRLTRTNSSLHKDEFFLLKFKLYGIRQFFMKYYKILECYAIHSQLQGYLRHNFQFN